MQGRDTRMKSPAEKFCYVCCNGNKHTNLVQCVKLKAYIGLHITHRSLCTVCLGTSVWDASLCVHTGQRNWPMGVCRVGKVARLLCKCKVHQAEQRWWACKHNPLDGFGNYDRMRSELPLTAIRGTRGPAQGTLVGGMPGSNTAGTRHRHVKRPGYSH